MVHRVCAGEVSSVAVVATIQNALCANLKRQLGVTTVPPQPPSGGTPAVLAECALLLVTVLLTAL